MASKELRDLFDGEAEESGDDARKDDDDEAMAEDDTGEDLKDFIAEGGDGLKTEERDGGESSSSEEDVGDLALEEGDLDLLEDLGIDREEARAKDKKRKRAGEDDGPALSRLRKTGGDEEKRVPLADNEEDLEEKLFGDSKDDMSDIDSKDPAAPKGIFDETDAESADDFIVRGDAEREARRKRLKVGDMDVTEEQMQEVMDIFGDKDVLEPVDQLPDGAPMLPVQDSTVEDDEQLGEALEPGEIEKSYATRQDMRIERANAPERWMQNFAKREECGLTEWTEEEHKCEAEWIYMEHFHPKGLADVDDAYVPGWQQTGWRGQWLDHEGTVKAILSVLDCLHNKKYEPIFVVTQLFWRYAAIFESADDIWGIAEKDLHWQGIWFMWRDIQRWSKQESGNDIPSHMAKKMEKNDRGIYEIFERPDAETQLKDIQAWFVNMFPQNSSASKTHEDRILDQLRSNSFHDKLGITSSLEETTLMVFGITPKQLGQNIEYNTKQWDLDEGQKQQEKAKQPEQLCQDHICVAFPTKDFVLEAISLYLARLISTDTRIRQSVRTRFWEFCAVSTSPTEKGKPIAVEAAHNFRRTYRAFHIVNRPLTKFRRDDLFLDVILLQKEGLINVEYSMIQKDPNADPSGAQKYKLIMPNHDENDLAKDKRKLSDHHRRKLREDTSGEGSNWEWCEKVLYQLELVAKAHEVEARRLGAKTSKAKANVLFDCASMQFPVDLLNKFLAPDPIYELMVKTYCRTEVREEMEDNDLSKMPLENLYVLDSKWNTVRKRIIKRALKDELYPMLWAEVQAELTSKAEVSVGKRVCEALSKKINLRPYHLPEGGHPRYDAAKGHYEWDPIDEDDEEEDDLKQESTLRTKQGLNPICALINDKKLDSWYLALVDRHGDPMEIRILLSGFWRDMAKEQLKVLPKPGTHLEATLIRREKHHVLFKQILEKYSPTLIVVGCADADAGRARRGIEELVNSMPKSPLHPLVVFGDTSVCRAVAYNQRCCSVGVYADYEAPQARMAIGLARYFQEPTAEVVQLWHEHPEENGLLKLPLHRLQKAIRPSKLHQMLMRPILEATAAAGVQINRVRRSVHLHSILQFVCGLGPRKARMALQSLSEPVKSRQELAVCFNTFVESSGSKNSVVENCAPFIKLDPDPRETWDPDAIDAFERTRLSDLLRPLFESFCKTALKKNDEDSSSSSDSGDEGGLTAEKKRKTKTLALVDAMKSEDLQSLIYEVSVEQWKEALSRLQLDADQRALTIEDKNSFKNLMQEYVHSELEKPFQDRRAQFKADQQDEGTFHMMHRTKPDKFGKATLVRCTVRKDKEYNAEGGKEPSSKRLLVDVELNAEGMSGSFRKQNQDQTAYLPGCDKEFHPGDSVYARVNWIPGDGGSKLSLSVDASEDMWYEEFPIDDGWDSFYFVPHPQENWTQVALGPIEDDKLTAKRALKERIMRPRNIRHANYATTDQDGVLKLLREMPMGNVIFRPSKRHDCMVAHLKVRQTDGENAVEPEFCYRTFEVKEVGSKGSSVAKELHVDDCVYHDFDEIIARHMDPIMENLRVLHEHSHYGLAKGEDIEKSSVRRGLVSFSRQHPTVLLYSLLNHDSYPGHATLIWCYRKPNPREEFIEVTPKGFTLWTEPFPSLKELIRWFKSSGWRQASKQRMDFKAQWEERRMKKTQERGLNILEGRKPGDIKRIEDQRHASATGLATPAGMASSGTPSYMPSGLESPAPETPVGGSRTPRWGGAGTRSVVNMGDGYVSPAPNANIAMPMTPVDNMQANGWRRPTSTAQPESMAFNNMQHVPRTPVGLRAPQHGSRLQPSTPAGLRSSPFTPRVLRATDVPQSPLSPGTDMISSPGTSTGLKHTPGSTGAAPETPAGLLVVSRGTVPTTPQSPPRGLPRTPAAIKMQVPMTPPTIRR